MQSGTGADEPLAEREQFEVYQVARELSVLASGSLAHEMPRDLRDQLDRAATQLAVLHLRGLLTSEQCQGARRLLLRVAHMLSRL